MTLKEMRAKWNPRGWTIGRWDSTVSATDGTGRIVDFVDFEQADALAMLDAALEALKGGV